MCIACVSSTINTDQPIWRTEWDEKEGIWLCPNLTLAAARGRDVVATIVLCTLCAKQISFSIFVALLLVLLVHCLGLCPVLFLLHFWKNVATPWRDWSCHTLDSSENQLSSFGWKARLIRVDEIQAIVRASVSLSVAV